MDIYKKYTQMGASPNVQYHLFTAHQIMYLRIAWIEVEGFPFELHFMTLRISCQQ